MKQSLSVSLRGLARLSVPGHLNSDCLGTCCPVKVPAVLGLGSAYFYTRLVADDSSLQFPAPALRLEVLSPDIRIIYSRWN
jgi:hypothetical protein